MDCKTIVGIISMFTQAFTEVLGMGREFVFGKCVDCRGLRCHLMFIFLVVFFMACSQLFGLFFSFPLLHGLNSIRLVKAVRWIQHIVRAVWSVLDGVSMFFPPQYSNSTDDKVTKVRCVMYLEPVPNLDSWTLFYISWYSKEKS